jgi:hypothetical protein
MFWTPRSRRSWTCSSPLTPRPTTTAVSPGEMRSPNCACTQVDSTWSRAASAAGRLSGSGCRHPSSTATSSAKTPSTSRPRRAPLRHRWGRSRRHRSHRPQNRAGLTRTGVPAGTAPRGPGASTHPVISWPSTRGRETGTSPETILRSVPQTPACATRTRARPSGSGGATSRTQTFPDGSSSAARMLWSVSGPTPPVKNEPSGCRDGRRSTLAGAGGLLRWNVIN